MYNRKGLIIFNDDLCTSLEWAFSLPFPPFFLHFSLPLLKKSECTHVIPVQHERTRKQEKKWESKVIKLSSSSKTQIYIMCSSTLVVHTIMDTYCTYMLHIYCAAHQKIYVAWYMFRETRTITCDVATVPLHLFFLSLVCANSPLWKNHL